MGAATMTLKVFISSTFKDLEAHRAKVIAGLRRLHNVQIFAMEDWTAHPDQPKDLCLKRVGEADIFVAIIGHLHGFVPKGDAHSITQSEYEEAVKQDKPILAFVAPDNFAVPPKLVREDPNLEAQDALRERILQAHTADLKWTSPEDLATRVIAAVSDQLRTLQPKSSERDHVLRIASIDFNAYTTRCHHRWAALDLTAVAAPGSLDEEIERPALSKIFIPQDCRRSRPPVSLPRDYLKDQGLDAEKEERQLDEIRQRWEREERLQVLELLGRPEANRIVLLGDPGAGKSSLMRFVLLELLESFSDGGDGMTDWRRALSACFPVLIELRDLVAREAEGHCQCLVSYLAYLGEKQGFGFDGATIEAQLRDRPSIILVDGLDEVFSLDRRRAMVEEIVGLEIRFPKARVVVTSRIAGFNAHPFDAAGFEVATLDDLSEDQVKTYARAWFDLAFPGAPSEAERARSDLLDTLQRRPQLKAVAGNPLILTIMAIVARHKRLARSRAQLYAQALEVLCYAWDYRRGLKLPADSPLTDLQPEDTLMMLRRIAWCMQESNTGLRANAIAEADLRTVLQTYFRDDWRFEPPKVRRAAAEMMQLLQERNWILTTRGPALFGFVHRTFLEYLCALELAERFRSQMMDASQLCAYVVPRSHDDSWREIARLLCGQLPVGAAQQLVDASVASQG
jgi:hypothetical protein